MKSTEARQIDVGQSDISFSRYRIMTVAYKLCSQQHKISTFIIYVYWTLVNTVHNAVFLHMFFITFLDWYIISQMYINARFY
jgi:hypothetical protein